MKNNHPACPCGKELADECMCGRSPLGSMRVEAPIGSRRTLTFAEAEASGDWIAYERTRRHYDSDGWCRCCCWVCNAHGCSHRSQPVACPGHPSATP